LRKEKRGWCEKEGTSEGGRNKQSKMYIKKCKKELRVLGRGIGRKIRGVLEKGWGFFGLAIVSLLGKGGGNLG